MTMMRPKGFTTCYRIAQDTLIVDLGTRMRVLSSAPRGGGFGTTRYIMNHQVPANPPLQRSHSKWEHPARYLKRIALDLGVDPDCVGLMTAVPMKQVVACRDEQDGMWVECFATVGVTNAVRAGELPVREEEDRKAHRVGTINLMVATNACLAASALVCAVQVVTESKTGVLRDHAVPSWTGRPGATGTGTDAVVVACALRGNGPRSDYAGTHTMIGALIGKVVADCLTQGLVRATAWAAAHRG